MDTAIKTDEELAKKQFLDALSESGVTYVSDTTALKFLRARKFDVSRACSLWRQHEQTRRREGLLFFEPFKDPLKTELATGKFTILATRDSHGAAIAVFTAKKHLPTESSHQTTLQGVVFQLDVALQSIETQKAGLVFIYDMTDSKYNNFDYELSQKILTLLKGGYPAKLKKVLIVTAPLWFKAPFRFLRLFVREKLRERVHTVSAPQLASHVPIASLPKALGGQYSEDHQTWLGHCLKCYANNADEMLKEYDRLNSENNQTIVQNGIIHNNVENMVRVKSDADRTNINITSDMSVKHNSADESDVDYSAMSQGVCWSDISSEDDSGGGGGGRYSNITAAQLVHNVKSLGRQGLQREYDEIRSKPPTGTFNNSKLPSNVAKNRYTDVLCYDHTRVLISQTDSKDSTTDYINANYVNGYKQKNAFISTQGPLPRTYEDFWRMVWEQHSLVIVMTTKTEEKGRIKCGQYWPISVGAKQKYGKFEVATLNVTSDDDYIVTEMKLTNCETCEDRTVSHWQYIRWPDYGVPGSAGPVLNFLKGVRNAQATALDRLGDAWAGHSRGPPIIVHCSAGIGRTGTFITLDICISSLEDTGLVNVRETVERIRQQRAHSMQTAEQYIFCHLAIIEYAIMNNFLESVDIGGFNDDQEESD